jgi:hypothetical protein
MAEGIIADLGALQATKNESVKNTTEMRNVIVESFDKNNNATKVKKMSDIE